jgi:hypothetical protein
MPWQGVFISSRSWPTVAAFSFAEGTICRCCSSVCAFVPVPAPISVLLGHSSIRITERHYAPWTRSRQEQIEADLKTAWSNDPVVLTDGKGTPELQGKTGQIN